MGWWMTLSSGVMTAWCIGLYVYSQGLYFEPLQKEFGWSRAEISAASSLGSFEGQLEGPIGGLLTDKYGPRLTNLLGIMLIGLGFILISFVNSLVGFLIAWGTAVGIGSNLGMWTPLAKALAEWFVKKRGLAMGIGRTIQTIGNSFVPTFMLILMIRFGWRTASLMVGLITLAIGIPLTWFIIKPRRPEFYGLMPDGAKIDPKIAEDQDALIRAGQEYTAREMDETEYTLRQALRTRTFWVVVLANAPRALAQPFFSLHFIPYLTDLGINPLGATAALGFMTFISIPGRLAGGALVDRLHIKKLKWIKILGSVLEWSGLLILLNARELWMVYLYAALRGPAMGLNSSSTFPISARFFGRKGFGVINGVRALMTLPVRVFSPLYVGWVYDTTGSYATALYQALIIYTISIFLWYFYDPPKKIEVISDVKKFL